MKRITQTRRMCAMLSIAVAVVMVCRADTCTDEELRHDVLEFLMTRCCGRVEARRVLTNEIRFDGDTNRLAWVLAEFVQTNDAKIAEWAMWQLNKYATSAQLPFLYSCATNPILGDAAVKSILHVEGVTSNSVLAARNYFALTNIPPKMTQRRDDVCISLVDATWSNGVPLAVRAFALETTYAFAANVNQCHKWLDDAIMRHDASYRYSQRRLSVLRSVSSRGINQYSYSYVTNAINELVAYPEANLPD